MINNLFPPNAFHSRSRLMNLSDWTLRVVIGLTYVTAGGMKLGGAALSVAIFNAIGWGDWFRYGTGVLEIMCGILVLFPRTSVVAAFLLACTMVGALIAHYFVGYDAVPAAVLLVLNLLVLLIRRTQAGAIVRSVISEKLA